MYNDVFESRHIGPNNEEVQHMLEVIGVSSIDELVNKTIPEGIRLKEPLDIPPALSEYEYERHIEEIADKNKDFVNYIGLGYHPTIVPAVIRRNVLENPGWYTAYTPYQAEISQGRLEGLLNFQTMVSDLTGMELANASLLDEATAAAEAMLMFYNMRSRAEVKEGRNVFLVDSQVFPHTIEVLRTRAIPLGIDIRVGAELEENMQDDTFGVLLQYPGKYGLVNDYTSLVSKAKELNIKVAVAADIMSLVMLTPPGEWGADCVVGTTQRFGVPMGYGGPHAAFYATKEEYKRHVPGRIIGVSQDREGRPAMRMALQTREQHIKRDRATSNICTAQALLAVMAGMYTVYHGPKGLKGIAATIHKKAAWLSKEVEKFGYINKNKHFFDTLHLELPGQATAENLRENAEARKININYINYNEVSISLHESAIEEDLIALVEVMAETAEGEFKGTFTVENELQIPENLQRKSQYLTHKTFNTYHSESEMMRYLKRLENKDISLTHSMISLGSCTMKLNAASELFPITNPAFARLHPFARTAQVQGYREVIENLEMWLSEITGFHRVSFQPNSGAQGEYAGLLVIQAYHSSRGDGDRNIALIPSSAHGTNPASAVMAGMKVVVVKCDEEGNIDVADLKAKAEQHAENLSCLMVTYPSTHGVFEESISEITSIIHENGGQVYMDGANMNAQVGLTSPGNIGADVCHLNLHKTFAIPHGGGGPGVGPIGVAKHLAPFLPSHLYKKTGGDLGISAVSSAPYGSALILLISYAYIRMLGVEGLTNSTKKAILNANYVKAKLDGAYDVLYLGKNGTVAHEMIVDCRPFKKSAGVEVVDIAKRLIDFGFHAPTVSFPVAGTLMIEPTESEGIEELDRFCEAMLCIREEIRAIENNEVDAEDNALKNAPHTAEEVVSSEWSHPYSREQAAYPLPWVVRRKYWPPVTRVMDAYGDRNLICSCPTTESYVEAVSA